MELCAFVTFPEYGWATKWRIYRKYTCNQKSKMAAEKLEMSCRLTLFLWSKFQHHVSTTTRLLGLSAVCLQLFLRLFTKAVWWCDYSIWRVSLLNLRRLHYLVLTTHSTGCRVTIVLYDERDKHGLLFYDSFTSCISEYFLLGRMIISVLNSCSHTPWFKKGCHPNHGRNFVSSWSICKIPLNITYSLLDRK